MVAYMHEVSYRKAGKNLEVPIQFHAFWREQLSSWAGEQGEEGEEGEHGEQGLGSLIP